MGLDMYLSRRTYVKNWDYMGPEERHNITISGPAAAIIKTERISRIEEQVAYWRKANAVHAWFVKNCQDGRDECQETYISREQLRALVVAVTSVLDTAVVADGVITNGYSAEAGGPLLPNFEDGKVIINPEVAEAILPSQKGCFFGGTDYDQYYLDDLRYTKEVLEALLAEPDGGSFYYQASW